MKKIIMAIGIIGIITTTSFATDPKKDWSLLPNFVWDSTIQIYQSEVGLQSFREMLGDWIDTEQEKHLYDYSTLLNPSTTTKKRYTLAFIDKNMFVVGYEEYKYEKDKEEKDMEVIRRVLLTFDFDYIHRVSLLKNITLIDFNRRKLNIDVVEEPYLMKYQLKRLGINGT